MYTTIQGQICIIWDQGFVKTEAAGARFVLVE